MTGAAVPSAETRPWLLPDEPVPVRLMNTVWADRHGVHDALVAPAHLRDWLDATGLDAGDVTTADVAAFQRLRDALRRLAGQLTGDLRPAAASAQRDVSEAVRQVNRAVDAGPAGPRLRLLASGGVERDDAPAGPAAALSTVARQAVELMTGDSAALLRACPAAGCVLYFVKDHPRRAWCSTGCGNRVRAARHYQRHRHEPAPVAPTTSRPSTSPPSTSRPSG